MELNESKILALDIGGGTQDILLYEPSEPMENAIKLVLPSPTVIAARRIEKAARDQKPIYLTGRVMGGGAVSRAVRDHIKAGLPVYSQTDPALTLHDNLDKVRSMGVLIEPPPAGLDIQTIRLGDLDLESLGQALGLYETTLPDLIALAVQDHGFSPGASNRLTRFAQWQGFLDAGGDLSRLLFSEPPENLSRWQAAAADAPGALFMDTSAAALRGAILDEQAAADLADGLTVVNCGNEHTVAFLVQGRTVYGVYEHHTSLLNPDLLADHLDRFIQGKLTNQEIFDNWGHGVATRQDYLDLNPFSKVVITGPRREMARGLGRMAAPFGEMMLSGCFGLIEAVREEVRNQGSG